MQDGPGTEGRVSLFRMTPGKTGCQWALRPKCDPSPWQFVKVTLCVPMFYSPGIEISNISETIIILVVSLKSNSEMIHEHYRMCAVRYILHECRKRSLIWRSLHTCLACSCCYMFTCPACKEICRNP